MLVNKLHWSLDTLLLAFKKDLCIKLLYKDKPHLTFTLCRKKVTGKMSLLLTKERVQVSNDEEESF